MIIWVHKSKADLEAANRAHALHNHLKQDGWDDLGLNLINTDVIDLINAINNNPPQPDEDWFIYMDDTIQLIAAGDPGFQDATGTFHLSTIDNNFHGLGHEHLTQVTRGKNSGFGMDDTIQLINNCENYTIVSSMGRNQNNDPDLFEITYHLPQPGSHITWYHLKIACESEVNIMNNLPPNEKQYAEIDHCRS